jgi:hypothetical protein
MKDKSLLHPDSESQSSSAVSFQSQINSVDNRIQSAVRTMSEAEKNKQYEVASPPPSYQAIVENANDEEAGDDEKQSLIHVSPSDLQEESPFVRFWKGQIKPHISRQKGDDGNVIIDVGVRVS